MEVDLAGHGDIAPDLAAGELGGQSRSDGHAGGGAVLGHRALRRVNVDIQLFVHVGRDAVLVGLSAQVGVGRLHAFLHHVAQLAGDGEFALAGEGLGFDLQHLAADLGPGQTVGHAQLGRFAQAVGQIAGHAQIVCKVAFAHPEGAFLAGDDVPARAAADLGDAAFQLAHAGLSGVEADDLFQRPFADAQLLLGDAVLRELLGDEVTLGDGQLFILGVAADIDDFHTVLQRLRDVALHVGRGDEHDVGQVVGYLQIVVGEGGILLRIQSFQ